MPGNLAHNGPNRKAVRKLLRHPSLIRISKHTNSTFATWFPKMYKYYRDTLGRLYEHDEELERLFPTASGQQCHSTLAQQLGATAIRIGGTWPSIEFPPGASIIIPSAVVGHSNVTIQPHETRYSFTQYAAGGLFRWVEHGFQKEAIYTKGLSVAELAAEKVRREQRKNFGLSLFSTMDELRALNQKA